MSLLESATLIASLLPELADQMRQYGSVYIDGFLAAPHNLETREFISLCECETDRIVERMSSWGSVYGSGTACGTGVLCLGGWRLTQNERLMALARAIGNTYLDEKFPVESRSRRKRSRFQHRMRVLRLSCSRISTTSPVNQYGWKAVLSLRRQCWKSISRKHCPTVHLPLIGMNHRWAQRS